MSRIFHRSALITPPLAMRGEGIRIYDADGKAYIDACGGAAVSCLGHGDPEVIEAIRAQAEKLAYAHTSFFTTEVAEELAELLISDAPVGLGRVYFLSDGSEAVECALKMAHQFHRERGETKRRHLIARWQSYHGNTLGALSVGGHKGRRAVFEPLLLPVTHIDPCYEYRYRQPNETPEEYGLRAANELEKAILELGPETVSAFIAETIVGATLGTVPPVPGYFKRVREICDRYGVLLILDEVMCGMGRSGTMHACEEEGISPDLLVIAKGLGAGYQPIGAVLLGENIFDAFRQGSGGFMHGHTFVGHPVACAAALAVQKALRGRNLLANVVKQGERLEAALRANFADLTFVGDIRGRGLFRSIELVSDPASKTPFDPAMKLNAKIKTEAMKNGLLCYPMGGTADGEKGDHVLLAPPFTVTGEDIEAIVDILDRSVRPIIQN
jgi:adenosylmethionine-8-amino-7-oxononanoate aminotransferase